jgi:hypothetical protein
MSGKFVGQVISRHTKGYGWVLDQTPGSLTQNTVIFFHQKFVNGGRFITAGDKITFDIVADPVHVGRTMAGNIDLVQAAPVEQKVGA